MTEGNAAFNLANRRPEDAGPLDHVVPAPESASAEEVAAMFADAMARARHALRAMRHHHNALIPGAEAEAANLAEEAKDMETERFCYKNRRGGDSSTIAEWSRAEAERDRGGTPAKPVEIVKAAEKLIMEQQSRKDGGRSCS